MMTDVRSLFPPEDRVPAHEVLDQREYLVDGRLRIWDGAARDVLSPVCVHGPDGLRRVRLGSIPLLDTPTAMTALDAAARAYDLGRGAWPTAPVAERIRAVEDFTFRMQEQRDRVVSLLMWEVGKTLDDSRKEFDRTVAYVQDTVDALKDLDRASSRFQIEQGIVGQIRRAPLGVVLCMGPYNYPLNETFTTLIPALIMGNPVVVKPPRMGVLLWRPLLEAFRDALPAGVANVIYGDGPTVAGPLMADGRVDVLAFIGSTRVANVLEKQHPRPHRLRCVLGLGAKNPAIVLPDADLELAVKECLLGTLSFNGQRCTALKMLFVHRSVAEDFTARLATAVDALKAGMPWEDGVQITPLPEDGKTEYLRGLVEDAVSHGARVANARGARVDGTFFAPTVLGGVTSAARVWREEQFGPVVPVAAFDDVREPLSWITDSPYGQQVSVFGRDPEQLARLIDPLTNQVCRVNLNSQCQRGPDTFPFTGRKDSAEGTLSVSDALRVFSIRTLLAAKMSAENKAIITDIARNRRSAFLSTDFIL